MVPSPQLPEHIGPYRVVRAIARGGMAEVYEVADATSGEHLALKLLLQAGSALPRFNREYEAMTRLNHPSIVRVYHYGLHQGAPWLTMELLEGMALQRRVKAMGRPGCAARNDEVMRIGYHIADALQYIHDRGLVHRDLKSANCVVLPDGRVKLLDFGTAHLADPIEMITVEGEFVGTFAYASPEQLTGGAIDHRSDLYSFGVLLYRMATGQRPFEAKDPHALARMHVQDVPRPPRELAPELPPEFERIILWLLEKDRENRPRRADEVARALEAAAERPLTALPGTGIALRTDKPVGRDDETRRVLELLDDKDPGRGVLVVGSEGSGRVRFVQNAASAASDAGWRVLQVTFRRNRSLGDLVSCLVEALASQKSADVDTLNRLAARDELEAPRHRVAVRQAVVGALLEYAARGREPLLFVVQQLQRSNPIALDLLVAMRRGAREKRIPIVFLGSCDESVEDPRSTVRQRWPDAQRVDLGAYTPQRVALAVGAMLHRRPPPADLARRIHAATGGQPAWVEEVVQQMVGSGALQVHSLDGSRLRWGGREDAIEVPPSARTGLDRLLSDLPLVARRVLEALAVIGGEAEVPLLAAGLGLRLDEVEPELRDLADRGWVERPAGAPVRFARPLVADVLREALHPARRHLLEETLSMNLEGAAPTAGQVGILLATGRIDEAVDRAYGAANRLMDEGCPADALAVLDRVVPVAGEAHAIPKERLALIYLLHTSCLIAVRPTDVATARSLMKARSFATDPELNVRVELTRARLQWVIGHYPNFRKILVEAWERVDVATAPRLASTVATHLAQSHLWSGETASAEKWYASASDAATASANPVAQAWAELGAANLLYARGALVEAEHRIAEAMQRFERLGYREGLWEALAVWTNALRQQGRFSEALSELYRRLPDARNGQFPSPYVRLLLATASCELDLCRLGRAQECLDELDVTIRKGEYLHLRVEAALVRGRILLASGQLREAAQVVGDVHQQARTAGLVVACDEARALLAETLWAQGEKEEARTAFQGAVFGLMGSGHLSALAEVCVSRARAQAEELPASEIFHPVRRLIDEEPGRLLQLEQLLAQARWHRARDEREAAAPLFRKAAAVLNRVASHLSDTDRAALRVHPWSRQIRMGLK